MAIVADGGGAVVGFAGGGPVGAAPGIAVAGGGLVLAGHGVLAVAQGAVALFMNAQNPPPGGAGQGGNLLQEDSSRTMSRMEIS
jgi:hypothetical protein